MREPDFFEQDFLDLLPVVRPAREEERQTDILPDRQGRDEEELLEDKTDMLPRIFTSSASFFPVTDPIDHERPAARGVKAPEDVHERSLAGAGWSDDGDELPCFNGKIYTPEGADLLAAPPVGLADTGGF